MRKICMIRNVWRTPGCPEASMGYVFQNKILIPRSTPNLNLNEPKTSFIIGDPKKKKPLKSTSLQPPLSSQSPVFSSLCGSGALCFRKRDNRVRGERFELMASHRIRCPNSPQAWSTFTFAEWH